MKFLYCPWRSSYAKTDGHSKTEETTEKECIFCGVVKTQNNEQEFVLRRFTYNFVMLNRFPYNAGHLLVVPHKHIQFLHDVSKEARTELMELSSYSAKIVQNVLEAHGINMGINFGKASGAGIPSHYHMHVLPRWVGDTNFLPILAETKQISFDLHGMYKKLKPAFDSIDQSLLI